MPYPIERRGQRRIQERKEAGMQFSEYHGWPNFPSWSVFTTMTSYDETRQALERLADHGTPLAVKDFVTTHVAQWKRNTSTPHQEAIHNLVQGFLMSAVSEVNWTTVYETLQAEQEAFVKADEITKLASELLKQTDWRTLAANNQANVQLRDWFQEQCFTWLDSPEARAHTGSVGRFANTVLDTYFAAVQWEKVTTALKGQ